MRNVHKWLILPVLLVLLTITSVSAGPPFDPASEPGLDRARDAANANARGLFIVAGVVGVGAGFTPAGEPAVVVLTESAGVNVPGSLDGLPVVVVVTGKIRALAPPPAGASFTATCSGMGCTFDGSGSTGRRLSFAWDFGDGNTGTGKVVDHPYAVADTYTVFLTVTDKDGLDDTASQDVTVPAGVSPPPTPPPGETDCYATGETTVKCQRPVPIGVSTGHPAITAGTIGARVIDDNGTTATSDDVYYALSNNHVYADENTASVGDAVIQPGAHDGGSSPADDIGNLSDFVPIQFNNTGNTIGITECDPNGATATCNVVDAAIALTTTGDLGNSTVNDGYGVPNSSTASASVGLKVQKCGRTTQCTSGRVFAVGATVNVGYGSGVARFIDQIVVVGGGFSAGGDSGSLVVTQKGGNKPVGLLFAGSANSTIINPIGPILTAFGVTIDGK